ncbi:MAG TPA: 4-alpha-glucanotransferase, partial [Nitrospira sp.]
MPGKTFSRIIIKHKRFSHWIMRQYEDAGGKRQHISEATLEAIQRMMGELKPDATSDRVLVLTEGERSPVRRPGELTLEDGATMTVERELPADLPMGYHQLTFPDEDTKPVQVIVSPRRCYFPPGLRVWGWNAQLYALRSRESWGIGDLADLRRLAAWSASEGAGMLLINPLHAPAPVLPQEPSPYSPTTRRYRSPLYLRVEEVPGSAQAKAELTRLCPAALALNEDRHIRRDEVFRLKMNALEVLWAHVHDEPDFAAYRTSEGQGLHNFAIFCVLAEQHGGDWRRWPSQYRRPDAGDVKQFAEEHVLRVRFHEWIQWLLDRQLAAASHHLAMMQDLPIGFSPGGADAWVWQDLLAIGTSVGAPPDLFNLQGQDWGLPPFVPDRLRATGYQPFIETIRATMRHAGGLRIDHVMGLFRLWWVPEGMTSKNGAYVRYPADDLLAIVAIESQRARSVVVGEDLGTVEEAARERLSRHNVLSYRVFWFEREPPSHYPEKALAAISTHDLPTLAGVWTGQDLQVQHDLGLKINEAGERERKGMVARLTKLTEQADVEQVIERAYARLSEAPSAIVMASLEDACAVSARPNIPGAGAPYPNWSLTLPMSLDELERAPLAQALARALHREKNQPP